MFENIEDFRKVREKAFRILEGWKFINTNRPIEETRREIEEYSTNSTDDFLEMLRYKLLCFNSCSLAELVNHYVACEVEWGLL